MAALLPVIARHPVVAFMVIGLGAYFLTAAIPPIVNAQVLPFDLPLHGVLGGVLGVGIGAFVVTGALAGRDGVVDLARRSLRWRVPIGWYLVALFTVPVGATLISLAIYGSQALASPAGGWPRAVGEVAAVFLLQLVLFQLAEEIGFTGFLQTAGDRPVARPDLRRLVAHSRSRACVGQTTRLDCAGRCGDQSVGGNGMGWFLPNPFGLAKVVS
jgi:membrane protease YdiL (CAAX protease family)